MKDTIREILLKSGACAVGFAEAGEIDPEFHEAYKKWIGEGCNGEMGYLERHVPLRRNTNHVLPGAKTVISIAFDYTPSDWRDNRLPYIASYAYGDDYHILLKELLTPVVNGLKNKFGGKWRISIDSAPLAERYWALKSGIGKRGLNGSVIVNGTGALCFLVEILTTIEIEADNPSHESCRGCNACIKVCPAKALRGDGTMDARKCINYLTIEKKEEFTEEETNLINSKFGYLYGCDRCLRICPHNKVKDDTNPPQKLFKYSIKDLSVDAILSMEEEEFKQFFQRSPLLYAGYQRLRRNAMALKTKSTGNI